MNSTAARELHLTIGSRFENIELVQAVVDDALREGGASEDARHWIGLALREAVRVMAALGFSPDGTALAISTEGQTQLFAAK